MLFKTIDIASNLTALSTCTHTPAILTTTFQAAPLFIPGPLIKSSAYPVQLPTCQQSHARTITHLPTISCPYNYPPANNLMPPPHPPANNLMPPPPPPEATHQIISISSTITHLPTISCPHHHFNTNPPRLPPSSPTPTHNTETFQRGIASDESLSGSLPRKPRSIALRVVSRCLRMGQALMTSQGHRQFKI